MSYTQVLSFYLHLIHKSENNTYLQIVFHKGRDFQSCEREDLMPLAKITDPIATITPITKSAKVVFGSDIGVSAFVIFVELKVGNNPFSP